MFVLALLGTVRSVKSSVYAMAARTAFSIPIRNLILCYDINTVSDTNITALNARY